MLTVIADSTVPGFVVIRKLIQRGIVVARGSMIVTLALPTSKVIGCDTFPPRFGIVERQALVTACAHCIVHTLTGV